MTYKWRYGNGTTSQPVQTETVPVITGGYRSPTSMVAPGDDTACPSGIWNVTPITAPPPGPEGFPVDCSGTGRAFIEIHGPGASEGCIVLTCQNDPNDWTNFRGRLRGNNGIAGCHHSSVNTPADLDPIEIQVTYSSSPLPVGYMLGP